MHVDPPFFFWTLYTLQQGVRTGERNQSWNGPNKGLKAGFFGSSGDFCVGVSTEPTEGKRSYLYHCPAQKCCSISEPGGLWLKSPNIDKATGGGQSTSGQWYRWASAVGPRWTQDGGTDGPRRASRDFLIRYKKRKKVESRGKVRYSAAKGGNFAPEGVNAVKKKARLGEKSGGLPYFFFGSAIRKIRLSLCMCFFMTSCLIRERAGIVLLLLLPSCPLTSNSCMGMLLFYCIATSTIHQFLATPMAPQRVAEEGHRELLLWPKNVRSPVTLSLAAIWRKSERETSRSHVTGKIDRVDGRKAIKGTGN